MTKFNLYLITNRKLLPDGNLLRAIEEALIGGVKAVQLREKDLKIRELLELAYKLRELTERYGASLFINDRVDVAVAVHADGVHLGRESMPPYAVKRVSKSLLVGVSTHSLDEALEAEKGGADFLTFGPVFPTPSKLAFGEPVGLDKLREVCSVVTLPVFAIGGIKPEHVKDVLSNGAKGVAVISAILGSEDIKSSVNKFMRCLK